MIRVLFLQHGLGYGGATKSLLLMQQALKDNIECYTVLNRTKRINQDIKRKFIYSKEFIEMDIPAVYSYSEGTIDIKQFNKHKDFQPDALIKYINERKIDILHINSSIFSNIVKQIKLRTKCKIVVHIREMLPFGSGNVIDAFIIENYIKYADATISISDNESKYFLKSKNLHIIPNPHDFAVTDPLVKDSESGKSKMIIGMCANFNPMKGHLIFLESAIIVNKKNTSSDQEIEFWIIGYPEQRKSFREIAKRILSYGYKSKFDKKVKSSKIENIRIFPFSFDIYQKLAELDIYVRPDISGNPWGRDIIEAMAFKKPVVATGESEFFIKNNVTGFLIPPKDPVKMADKLIDLVKNKNKREMMGNNGYKEVKDICSMSAYRARILEVYNSL